MAVDVCEQAGKPFFYSTKSDIQQVDLHHGQRLVGAMTLNDMLAFCRENDVRCIVDAAHPFAENLHRTIEELRDAMEGDGDEEGSHFPVIRLERTFGDEKPGVIYCDDYAEAVRRLQAQPANKLLALSGANTIVKLKPYWQAHPTVFRILDRDDSRAMATQFGLSADNLIYYKSDICHSKLLPTVDEEMALMREVGCDAILTKESGETGGFNAKVDAALSLGLRVYAVRRPRLPLSWKRVTGRHGLRRAIEHAVPSFFPLKTGLTTGACATAAFKAALLALLHGDTPEEVSFALPDGEIMSVPVDEVSIVSSDGASTSDPGSCCKAMATVTKDFSDDPDVTKGCRISAEVELSKHPFDAEAPEHRILFLQGPGVGRVTLPGLGIPVGGPAINVTPRRMMEDELCGLTDLYARVTLSVEGGEELARQTFNPKVGVVDGISIIGTSGIVSPLSNEAFVQSIRRELEVARAIGCTAVGLASGKRGEDALHEVEPSLRVVHYGNFIGASLQAAHELGFRRVELGIMIGKAVKLAEGHLDTHSHKVVMNKAFLKQVAREIASTPGEVGTLSSAIDRLTMARELWQTMPPAFFERITNLCLQQCRPVFPEGKLEVSLIPNS